MSKARRHHYLPVFLLKRFKLERSRSTPRVRVLRHDGVREIGVHNVGVERDFHTATTMVRDPEQMISRWEAEIASELNRWKAGPLDEKGGVIADRMVAHLRLRSRVMRSVGSQLMSTLVAGMNGGMRNAVTANRPSTTLAGDVEALIRSVAERAGTGLWNDRELEAAVGKIKTLIQGHASHWSVAEASRIAEPLLNSDLAREIVAGTHTSLILMTLLNQRKRAAFGNCHWEVIRSKERLLLGDVGPIGLYANSRQLRAMTFNGAVLRAICLPIGPHHLLVGRYDRQTPVPSPGALNTATVALSHEFVVGTMPEREMEKARPELGKRASEDSAETMLGLGAPTGGPVVEAMADELAKLTAQVIDRYWSGTACRQSDGVVTVPTGSRDMVVQGSCRPDLLTAQPRSESAFTVKDGLSTA